MRALTKYFNNPPLPLWQEDERSRIIIFRKYLAIIFALYVFALALELIFDFRNFTWFNFVAIMLSTSFLFLLSITNIPHRFVLTAYFISILISNQLQFFPNPKAFHVWIFWIGISPLYVAVLATPKATLIWTLVFIASLFINGFYIIQTVGVYEATLYPNLFLVAGIFFILTTSLLAVFFSYTQKKLREELYKQNLELQDLAREVEGHNTQLKNYNEHLEERVYERTEELEHQNKQLTEYAFINSHLLRAPLSSILGIVDLLSRTKLNDEQMEYVKHLITASTDLDEVIAKINKAISGEGRFSREAIQKLKGKK